MSLLTIQTLLQEAKQKLTAITDNPQFEAEILLAHALNQSRVHLHARPEQLVEHHHEKDFVAYIARRLQKEPIAYITGVREFWSLPLFVTQDTLIPRPETELLVEKVLHIFPAETQINMIDLGTGSGAIALAIAHERPHWQIYAIDSSEKALQIASKNAQHLQINNVTFCHSNWLLELPAMQVDLIVSNPPYIAANEWERVADQLVYEPKAALVSGADGLKALSDIIVQAYDYLKLNGVLILEHGYSQAEAVHRLFSKKGYNSMSTLKDLAGLDRITMACKR